MPFFLRRLDCEFSSTFLLVTYLAYCHVQVVVGGKLKGEALAKNELSIIRHSPKALEKTIILLEKH